MTVVTLTTDEVLEVFLLTKVQLILSSRRSTDFFNGFHNVLLPRKTFMCHCWIIKIINTWTNVATEFKWLYDFQNICSPLLAYATIFHFYQSVLHVKRSTLKNLHNFKWCDRSYKPVNLCKNSFPQKPEG